MLRERIFELASDFDIPVSDEDITLTHRRTITRSSTAPTRAIIELVPGFGYPWPFDFHIDTLSGIARARHRPAARDGSESPFTTTLAAASLGDAAANGAIAALVSLERGCHGRRARRPSTVALE